MMERLTKQEQDFEYRFCSECVFYGEPNGCNAFNGGCKSYYYFTETAERLRKYEDAEEAGLLVRLPYALGAECYYANSALHEVCPAEIIGYEINRHTIPSLWVEFEYVSKCVGRHAHKEREDLILDKLLFHTAEEAEQALKEA